MLIIADENIEHQLIQLLRKEFEVYSIYESNRSIDDLGIVALASQPNCLIITEDKDFGEIVFAKQHRNISVLLLRYTFEERTEMHEIVLNLLKNNGRNLLGKFTSASIKTIRTRDL